MKVVKLVRRHGASVAIVMAVWLYSVTSGCAMDPPASSADPATSEPSVLGDPAAIAPPIAESCPPCPLVHVQPAPGGSIGDAISGLCSCTLCGDGICNNGETHATCSPDCPLNPPPPPPPPACGNRRCEAGEPDTCPQDCCGQQIPPCPL